MPGWAIGLIIGGGCLFIIIPLMAIMAAFLFPVFAKSREAARKATCQTNLKELSMSLRMYSSDYGGRFPSAPKGSDDLRFETAAGSPSGTAPTWTNAVSRYAKSHTIQVCPSDSKPSGGTSYYYKHAVNLAGRAKMTEADFSYPADQIVLYERQSFHWGGGPITDGATLNAAFFDGHIGTVRMVDVAPDKEPRYFNYLDPSTPKSAKAKKPYWDPRYCYDKLY